MFTGLGPAKLSLVPRSKSRQSIQCHLPPNVTRMEEGSGLGTLVSRDAVNPDNSGYLAAIL
jgi:hypothetical protein